MKFDLEKFTEDVFRMRTIKLKTTRLQVSYATGLDPMVIRDFENKVAKNPSIHSVIQLCNWMDKPIQSYIKS